MPKVLSAIYSYEDMKEKWSQDNPNDAPYTRRPDLESGIYELDKWIIRVNDEGKTISTVGWKEHPSHTVVGGMLATTEGKKIGQNNRVLNDAREPQLNQSKPLVAAFGFRDGDNARWIAKAKQNGWKFPDDSEFEQMKQLLPESVFNEWNSAYPNGNWAIRSIRGEGEMAKCVYLDDPIPDWFNMLKWRPDETFQSQKGDEIISPDKYSSNYKVRIKQHYLETGNKRLNEEEYYNRTDMLPELINKLNTHPDTQGYKGKIWFYFNDDKFDLSYVDGKIISNNPVNEYIFESIRSLDLAGQKRTYIGYPAKGEYKFIDIHNTGIKEFHNSGKGKNVFRDNTKANLRRKHEEKNKPKSVYSEAKTGDEAYDIYKETYFIPFEEKVQKLRNKRDNATNPATKEKTQKQIDKLEKEQRKEYERYKRIALRLGD